MEIPEPIAGALARAKSGGQLVLVDFYADWCVPCRILEADVIPDPRVQHALAGFVLIKVDTDRFPGAATSYGINVMPTLLVLDADGLELDRIAGKIETKSLFGQLKRLSRSADKKLP